jgi:hypothetical protein
LALFFPAIARAQATGQLQGRILDPNGAVISGAAVILTRGRHTHTTQSDKEGVYLFKNVSPGTYTLQVKAKGFQPYSQADVAIEANRTRRLNIPLAVAVQHQRVTVRDESNLGVNPDQNASTVILKGRDLEALSDNPTELQNELQALAGPGAGPGGPQIYINGFSGGQMPPKSAIREIRINQDPFSAKYARPGYGRIEIFTKSGTKKFSGNVSGWGNVSSMNTAVPLVGQRPDYYIYSLGAEVTGPITEHSSYIFGGLRYTGQLQSIIDAVDPTNTSARIYESFPGAFGLLGFFPSMNFSLGDNNTLVINDLFLRASTTGDGVGQFSLPEQEYRTKKIQNGAQFIETVILGPHWIDETHFQWLRTRASQNSSYFTPSVTLQGAFTTGGNSAGVLQDHRDIFELMNDVTAMAGNHTVHFGALLRATRDANYSTAGANGTYFFSTVDQYDAKKPALYQVTVIKNPLARVILFDGAVYLQDDWKMRPNLTVSGGLRFETQNRINDHSDWGPRFAFSWAPGQNGKKPANTVLHAGYGWFYNRFTVPNFSSHVFNTVPQPPYIMKAIHQNGINQQSYVFPNPDFYNPDTPGPPAGLTGASASIPSIYSVDRHFHAALDMQAAVGVDRQIAKNATLNVSYRYTRGVHQYLTNNVTAPAFDPTTYTIIGPTPTIYNNQFQSGGVYKQHQVVVTASVKMKQMSLHATYTYNHAKSDTQGVGYFPSIAQDPALDYGPAEFGVRHRLILTGDYTAPYGISIAPFLAVQSGTPYNITIGSDLTGNNQFNARPTYGTCGAPDVVSTPYGCLDASPVGKGEKIVPYGLGIGPSNFVVNLRLSKTFGFGPRTKDQGKKEADRYKLTLSSVATNLFNIVNLGPPNGTLNSPLFGTSQSLAGGVFASQVPGNRFIDVGMNFGF